VMEQSREDRNGVLKSVRDRWRAALTLLGGVTDHVPLTWMGVLMLAACLVAFLHYGLDRIDLVLLVIGSIGVSVMGLSLVASGTTALVLWLRMRHQDPGPALTLECGYPARTGYSIPVLWYVPFIHITWTWVSPQAQVRLQRQRRRLVEEVLPERRGVAGYIVRRFEIQDIFGLTRVVFRSSHDRAVTFLPSMGALKQMHVVHGIAGGQDIAHPEGPAEGDRFDMRHYYPGDPIRFVLWKIFAKSRRLLIRTPERAIAPDRRTIAYMVAADGDEPAAGAVRMAVDTGVFGPNWLLGTDGNPVVVTDKVHALDLLALSAQTPAKQSATGLTMFLQTAVPGTVGRAVVFVPARTGPWLHRAISAARIEGMGHPSVEDVVCADGIRPAEKRPWWSYLVKRRRKDPGEFRLEEPTSDEREVANVVKALAATRARVTVGDRVKGRVYDQSHLGKMMS
jgi:hypothetical protein